MELATVEGAPAPSWIPEIEQEVLGAIMCRNDTLAAVQELRPQHFIEPIHGLIFIAIQTALERYNSTAAYVVVKLLDDQIAASFEAQTGTRLSSYVAKLTAESVYGAGGLVRSARAVVEQWARYQIAIEAQALVIAAGDPSSAPAEIVSRAGIAFDEVLSETRRGAKGRKTRVVLGDAVGQVMGELDDAIEHGVVWDGISWGLTDLDHVTGGIQSRDLTLIGARPSIGKTTFALSTALRAAKKGIGVGFISLEMDAVKLAARAASDLAFDWNVRVKYQDIIRRTVDREHRDLVASAIREIGDLPLWIEDQSGMTVTDIRVKLERLMLDADRAGHPIKLVHIDHLGLIRPSDSYRDNRAQQVGEITAALKSMAREYEIAIVLLSQLNRSVEGRDNKRPSLADLRDSGSIEQDADCVMFLFREAYYLRSRLNDAAKDEERVLRLADVENKMEVSIAKQRNGPVKTIDVASFMPFAAIRNAARGYGE